VARKASPEVALGKAVFRPLAPSKFAKIDLLFEGTRGMNVSDGNQPFQERNTDETEPQQWACSAARGAAAQLAPTG
jgi:hypothetical protein